MHRLPLLRDLSYPNDFNRNFLHVVVHKYQNFPECDRLVVVSYKSFNMHRWTSPIFAPTYGIFSKL